MMSEKGMLYFNAKLSTDKTMIGSHPNSLYVLGYHHRNGRPYREEIDLLSHLFYPERPQDFGRLAASALGLAYASLGCSVPFYNLCKDIHHKLVIEGDYKVNFKAWKWMKKAGIDTILEQMRSGEFPSYSRLLELGILPYARTETENEHQWPTIPKGIEGEIIFLNRV